MTYTRKQKIDLTVNKLDRETFDALSASQISPKELWFITSADSVVVDIDKIGTSRDWTPEISELSADKRDYDDLTVQNQIDMPPYYNIRSITWNYGTGETTYSNFWIDADKKRCWTGNTAFSTQIKTTDGQTFEFVGAD